MSVIDLDKGKDILSNMVLFDGLEIRFFQRGDFKAIQDLYEIEGWATIIKRPEEGLKAWEQSYPALVMLDGEKIVGVIRGLTDTEITTYIVELLIDEAYRGKGLGSTLIEACHLLHPHTRLEVLATHFSKEFYETKGFRSFYGYRKSYY